MLRSLARDSDRLAFYFDVHSHSNKKSIFMYGPHFPLHSEHYLKIRILPKLLQSVSKMFRYYSCRFKSEKNKKNCSRLALSRYLRLPTCYTIETSMMGFIDPITRVTEDLSPDAMAVFGRQFAETILDWFILLDQNRLERIKRAV